DCTPTSLQYNNEQINLTEIKDKNGESVNSFLKRNDVDAYLIIHKNKVIYENYFNNYKSYEPHAVNSVTKSFVGLVTTILADKGELDLNQKAEYYIPELKNTGLGNGTIQELLHMQVPVKYKWEQLTPGIDIGHGTPIFYATDSLPKPRDYNGPENLYEFMLSSTVDVEPGTKLFYENGQTETIGWVLKCVTGENLSSLIQEIIWSKIGAEENALMLLDPIGTEIANCGMRATLRDLAKFGQMMLQNGHYNGKQIVPEHLIEDIKQGGNQDFFAKRYGDLRKGFSYFNKWWVSHDQFDTYSARGRFGQQVIVSPKTDTVIVQLASHRPRLTSEPPFTNEVLKYLSKN